MGIPLKAIFKSEELSPKELFVLVFITGVVSISLRWWLYRMTAGFSEFFGTEDAYRMDMIFREDLPFTTNIGPMQALFGRALAALLPQVSYPTQAINLVLGSLSPIVLLLALKRHGFFVAFGAAFALAICPGHIIFSTVGTGEVLCIFFIIFCAYALEEASKGQEADRAIPLIVWTLVAITAYATCCLTRFEYWAAAPFLVIFVFITSKKFRWLSLGFLIGPAIWMIFSKVYYGAFFESSNLVNPESLEAAKVALDETLNRFKLDLGTGRIVGGTVGLVLLLFIGKGFVLTASGTLAFGFILLMLKQGKIPGMDKYALHGEVWFQIYLGVFIAMMIWLAIKFLEKLLEKIDRFPWLREKGLHPLGLVIVGLVMILVLTWPAMLNLDWKMSQDPIGRFSQEKQVLQYVLENSKEADRIFPAISVPAMNYVYLQLPADMKSKWLPNPYGWEEPCSQNVRQVLNEIPRKNITHVLARRFPDESFPKMDLRTGMVISQMSLGEPEKIGAYLLFPIKPATP